MKYDNAFLISFFSSLALGALVFYIPIFLLIDKMDEQMEPFICFYSIYAVVQLILSLINIAQAKKLSPGNEEPEVTFHRRLFFKLLKGELTLYCIIYSVLWILCIAILSAFCQESNFTDLMQGMFMILAIIFCFSLPYCLCCTASIFIFYRLLTMPTHISDTESHIENYDK
jgi:O-antigen/teichoic acid export membrane protein